MIPQEESFFTDIVASHGDLTRTLLINAFMLHPDDGSWRTEYICKALLRYIADQNTFAISQKIPPMTVHSGLAVLLTNCMAKLGGWTKFYESVTAFRKENLEKDFMERFAKGIITGAILHIAIRRKASISQAIEEIVAQNQCESELQYEDRLRIYDLDINLTESNLSKNVWPKYKRAAHLWASLNQFLPPVIIERLGSRVFVDIASLRSENPHIPSGGFEGFFIVAAHYLEKASLFTPPRSNKPLLDKKEALEFFFDAPCDHSATP